MGEVTALHLCSLRSCRKKKSSLTFTWNCIVRCGYLSTSTLPFSPGCNSHLNISTLDKKKKKKSFLRLIQKSTKKTMLRNPTIKHVLVMRHGLNTGWLLKPPACTGKAPKHKSFSIYQSWWNN